jgi:hypothetical protein
MAAFAARGGSTSSKNGTGSPRSLWNGPRGQSPTPTPSATPSMTRKPTDAGRIRSRRLVTALNQMCASVNSPTTDHAAWNRRKALARRGNSDQETVDIQAMVEPPVGPDWLARCRGSLVRDRRRGRDSVPVAGCPRLTSSLDLRCGGEQLEDRREGQGEAQTDQHQSGDEAVPEVDLSTAQPEVEHDPRDRERDDGEADLS